MVWVRLWQCQALYHFGPNKYTTASRGFQEVFPSSLSHIQDYGTFPDSYRHLSAHFPTVPEPRPLHCNSSTSFHNCVSTLSSCTGTPLGPDYLPRLLLGFQNPNSLATMHLDLYRTQPATRNFLMDVQSSHDLPKTPYYHRSSYLQHSSTFLYIFVCFY